MAKSKTGPSFRAELLKFNLYKRNQGRLTRQLTAVTLAVLILFGAYTLSKGPLSGYANSFWSMTVRYASTQPDDALDNSIRELAEKHGGLSAQARQGSRFRELTYQFPTSRRWQTDEVLVQQMKEKCNQFAQAVKTKYPEKVRVSEPRRQSRPAVAISLGIPTLLCVFAAWVVFRAMNYPRFADFLISVEAEMDKVSWPNRTELYRSTAVVVTTMFFLGFVLLSFDAIWQVVFEMIGFLRLRGS